MEQEESKNEMVNKNNALNFIFIPPSLQRDYTIQTIFYVLLLFFYLVNTPRIKPMVSFLYILEKRNIIRKMPDFSDNIANFDTLTLYQNISYKMSLCYHFDTKRHPY